MLTTATPERNTMELTRLTHLVAEAIASGDAEQIRAAYREVQTARQANLPAAARITSQAQRARATRVHLIALADSCRSALGIAR